MSDDLRYPVGRFQPMPSPAASDRADWLRSIEGLPGAMRAAVDRLDDQQLDTPYRDGGWTVRQVVHHVPDSHMNGYIRTCLALTEDNPTIRPYNESAWSALPYMRTAPIHASLDLLASVHDRWLGVLKHMTDADWNRRLVHPEDGARSVEEHIQLYEWHGRHHVAHITRLRERRGW
jgi:hypothetical protein